MKTITKKELNELTYSRRKSGFTNEHNHFISTVINNKKYLFETAEYELHITTEEKDGYHVDIKDMNGITKRDFINAVYEYINEEIN